LKASGDHPTASVPESPDQSEIATHLKRRVHELGARFLLTELETGLALLDVAETSQNGELNQRRRALALEAHEVVATTLARGSDAVPLTIADHARIQHLYQELGKRLGR